MKIALISVAPPYRGGISKHTYLLVKQLKVNHSVEVVNYYRQYPNIFFPGRSQLLDYKSDFFEFNNRIIDSINPISWFKTGNLLSGKKLDLVIFRFWNPFFVPALYTIASIIKKKAPQTKLISLCDNIIPHEKVPLGALLTKYFFKKLDGHLVQSSQTQNELIKLINLPKYEKRFHPLYTSFSCKVDKLNARKILKLGSKNIILYFGIIRKYKGLDVLLKSISMLMKKRDDFHLLVAGECYGDDSKYLSMIKQLNICDFVTWENRYIPDDEVHLFFSAADIVALPYRSASQSGITQIAYNYNLPVIVSNVGGLPEIVDSGKSGYIIKSEDSVELANVLNENLGTNKLIEMSDYIKIYKEKFSWEYFVEGIELLYKKL